MIRSALLTLTLITLASGSLTGCSSGWPTTFYVSPEGDDDGPGTENEPWLTIQTGIDRIGPGETLLVRAGVYEERLIIVRPREGGDEPIVIANYPGETPVIDGTNLSVERGFSALVLIRDQDYLRFEGFELRNYRSDMGRRNPVGIFVTGRGSNIDIANNDIHDIEALATSGQRDGHGIAVYGTSQHPLTQVRIVGNRVHDLILGTSEAVVINGNVDGFEVSENEVFDTDNIGIDIIGFEGKAPDPELDRARNGTVSDNHVHGIDTARNPSYDERNAGGIYVDGGTNITIERNVLHHNNMGIEIASEHSSGNTSFVTVKNNVIYANHIVGLAMGGYDSDRGQTLGCTVSENTFYDNDTDREGNGELFLQFDVVDNTVTRNLIVAGEAGLLIANPYVENENNTVDHNLYFVTGPGGPEWQWKTQPYHDFGSYLKGTGNDAHSVLSDPGFADPGGADFRSSEAPTTTNGERIGASDEVLERAANL